MFWVGYRHSSRLSFEMVMAWEVASVTVAVAMTRIAQFDSVWLFGHVFESKKEWSSSSIWYQCQWIDGRKLNQLFDLFCRLLHHTQIYSSDEKWRMFGVRKWYAKWWAFLTPLEHICYLLFCPFNTFQRAEKTLMNLWINRKRITKFLFICVRVHLNLLKSNINAFEAYSLWCYSLAILVVTENRAFLRVNSFVNAITTSTQFSVNFPTFSSLFSLSTCVWIFPIEIGHSLGELRNNKTPMKRNTHTHTRERG